MVFRRHTPSPPFPSPLHQLTAYNDLLLALGDARSKADKRAVRALATVTLPRLALHAALPASALQPLATLAAGGGAAGRLALALLTTALGPGDGGTPAPGGGAPPSLASDAPAPVLTPLWAAAADPVAPSASVEAALRCVAAAARGGEGRWDGELVSALGAALERGEREAATGGASSTAADKASGWRLGKRTASASSPASVAAFELCGFALAAARAAARGRALKDVASRALPAAGCADALVARHALALVAGLARTDPSKAALVLGGFPAAVAAAVAAYDTSPLVIGAKAAKPGTAAPSFSTPGINLADPWARVYAARAAAALLHSRAHPLDTPDGGALWSLLMCLTARDADDMVALEAAKCLFGWVPGGGGGNDDARDAAARISRAWTILAERASEAAVFIPGLQSEDAATLLGAVACRVRGALRSPGDPALVCAGARTAAAAAEALARGTPRSYPALDSPAVAVVTALGDDLGDVLASGSGPEAAAALEALLWLASVDTATTIPADVVADTAARRHGWSDGLSAAVLATGRRVVRARPMAAASTLATLTALVAGAPSKAPQAGLAEAWTAASAAGGAAHVAAARSALSVLTTPRIATTDDAAAAADDAGWDAARRLAAWWLGDNVNVAAGAVQGSGVVEDAPPSLPAPLATIVAPAAASNPLLSDTLGALAHAAATLPWPGAVAAVGGLAKLAARSPSPWRAAAYQALAPHAAPAAAAHADALGVAFLVRPILAALDDANSAACAVSSRPRGAWDAGALDALRDKHASVCSALAALTGPLPDGCWPLGRLSRALLETGELPGKEKRGDAAVAPVTPAPVLDRAKLEALLAGAAAPASTRGSSDEEDDFGGFGRGRDDDDDSDGAAPPPLDALAAAAAADNPLASLHSALDALVVARPGVAAAAAWGDDDDGARGGGFGAPDTGIHGDALAAMAGTPRAVTPSPSIRAPPPPSRGVVAHAFEAALPEELTVARGDTVSVVADVDGWLDVVRDRDGARGLVPASYVATGEEAEGVVVEEAAGVAADTGGGRDALARMLSNPSSVAAAAASPSLPPVLTRGGSTSNPFGDSAAASPPPVMPRSARSRRSSAGGDGADWAGVVSFAFEAENDDELSVAPGDAVRVVGEVDGWVHAVRVADGGKGLVPASYVERV